MDQSQKACKKKRNSVKIMLKDLHYKIVTKSLSNRVSTWNHFFYYDKTLAFFAELNLFLICSSKTKMCQKAVQPSCLYFLFDTKIFGKVHTRKCVTPPFANLGCFHRLLTISVEPAAPGDQWKHSKIEKKLKC